MCFKYFTIYFTDIDFNQVNYKQNEIQLADFHETFFEFEILLADVGIYRITFFYKNISYEQNKIYFEVVENKPTVKCGTRSQKSFDGTFYLFYNA